jgi:uncharacterized protein
MDARARGHGVGVRAPHYARILKEGWPLPWAEVITENFLRRGGRPLAVLESVRRDANVILHGVSLSLGGTDPLDLGLVRDVAALARRFEVAWVSEHLCFGTVEGQHGHDLWPLPYTEEALRNVVERIQRPQDVLGRRLVLENVSTYLEWADSTLREWEFVSEVSRRADCFILLDVNNVYVNGRNHGNSPSEYLSGVPAERVAQYHLAGHEDHGQYVLDTHDHQVPDEVWALYGQALSQIGPRVTIVEWDGRVPPLETVMAESAKAHRAERAVGEGLASCRS